MQANPAAPPMRFAAVQFGIGALTYTGFGTLWAAIGAVGLQGTGEPFAAVVLGIIIVTLLGASTRYLRSVRRLPSQEMSPSAEVQVRHIRHRFRLLSVIEGVSIGLVWWLCYGLGQPQYAFPATALVVGLHFFALAPLFGIAFDYAIGGSLCVLALGTVLLVPVGGGVWTWNAVVGLGSACLLWVGAAHRLAGGMALLRAAHQLAEGHDDVG